MDLDRYQQLALTTNHLHEDSERSTVAALLGLSSETGSILNIYKRYIRDKIDLNANRDFIEEELGDLLWYVSAVASSFELSLESIAQRNLRRINDYFAAESVRRSDSARLADLDAAYPSSERLPRLMKFSFVERIDSAGRPFATVSIVEAEPLAYPTGAVEHDGHLFGYTLNAPIGDSLSDNSRRADGYRFHDALHLGFAAVLGWSPTIRQMLHLKRKSNPHVDEGEDGARAIFTEEGVTAMLAQMAVRRLGYQTDNSVDMETIEVVRAVVSDLECHDAPAWLWRRAISQGFVAMRQLEIGHGGYLVADLDARTLSYAPVTDQGPNMTAEPSSSELAEAIAVLHAQKDEAYRNAWKKRGEVVGVIANIARKADRLENVLDGATSTPDESLLDTAIDLFVYTVKYRAFLADRDPAVDKLLFPGGEAGWGERSNGTRYVTPLLLAYGERALPRGSLRAIGDAVLHSFERLESSFGAEGWDPPTARYERASELADLAWDFVAATTAQTPELAAAFVRATR